MRRVDDEDGELMFADTDAVDVRDHVADTDTTLVCHGALPDPQYTNGTAALSIGQRDTDVWRVVRRVDVT